MRPNLLSNHLFRTLSAGALLLCAIMALDMRASLAEPGFNFNWTSAPSALYEKRAEMRCNFPGASNAGSCAGSIVDPRFFSFANTAQNGTGTDTTPFVQEFVEVGGVRYYHVIVGDGRSLSEGGTTNGFAQEVYIRVGSNNLVFADGHESSSSGGRGFKDSSDWRSCADGAAVSDACANGWDPLRNNASVFTGNGTGNPERVIMRQVIKDGALFDTFEKILFSQKPKISQKLSALDIAAEFTLDMGNSDYKASTTVDNARSGTVINKVTLIGPNAGIPGNFDATAAAANFTTANAPAANVTGGRFTWAPGPNADFGFSSGSYSYSEGNFDVNAVKWKEYKN